MILRTITLLSFAIAIPMLHIPTSGTKRPAFEELDNIVSKLARVHNSATGSGTTLNPEVADVFLGPRSDLHKRPASEELDKVVSKLARTGISTSEERPITISEGAAEFLGQRGVFRLPTAEELNQARLGISQRIMSIEEKLLIKSSLAIRLEWHPDLENPTMQKQFRRLWVEIRNLQERLTEANAVKEELSNLRSAK